MDVQNSSLAGKSSALPRPLSKLPLPRTIPQQAPAPPQQESRLPGPARPNSQSISSSTSHRSNSSTTSLRSNTITSSNSGEPQSPARPPLSPKQRPESKQGLGNVNGGSFDAYINQARQKAIRHPSQQENTYQIVDSPEGSDESNSNPPSPVNVRKKGPRPSLSDRTVESLSNIPPSPGVDLRRSSFFYPTSPLTPSSRPTSSMGQNALPKPSYGINRGAFIRPPSPTKNINGSGTPASIPRRTASTALPRNTRPVPGTPSHKRAGSTMKPAERPVSVASLSDVRSNSVRTPKQTSVPSTSSVTTPSDGRFGVRGKGAPLPHRKPTQSNGFAKPSVQPQKQLPKKPQGAEEKPAAEQTDKPKKNVNSSAALRAQIAQARASQRKAAVKPDSPNGVGAEYDFEGCEDPFNQGFSTGQKSLLKKIETARSDGRLNIAALGLKQIPPEVLQMYDAEAMEASSLTWSGTVDLVRFNAADNEIETIPDEVFPDASAEELASQEDSAGNQFGGLESLDFHGNLLTNLPVGVRRLEMLSTLNLARNKLDNEAFKVVTELKSLRELYLNDNEFSRVVPESIGNLTNLEILHLQNNRLTILPGAVRNLINLRILKVSNNRFPELPMGSLMSLPSLVEISASKNALTGAFFPPTVDILRKLETLDVSNNAIASLTFGSELHLPALQYMNISRNRLIMIPDVSSWTSLIHILAEENSITSLPNGIGKLNTLKVANFNRNDLRSLDPEVAKLDSLENLEVAANPLREKKFLTMKTPDLKEELMKKLENAE